MIFHLPDLAVQTVVEAILRALVEAVLDRMARTVKKRQH
jgi:hypothetical protein